MHLDVLEEYRGQGLGTLLIEKLCNQLQEMNVEGVRLICGKNNEQARAFYENRGFEDIDYITGAVVYGKKFFQ